MYTFADVWSSKPPYTVRLVLPVAREPSERLAVEMRCEVGPHRVLAFLAHVVGLAPAVQLGHGRGQRSRLFAAEEAGEEEVAVALELRVLLGSELHE